MARRFAELQGELHGVEARIRELTRSDGFVEDLIELEKRRKTLLAELLCSQPESRQAVNDSVLWLRAPMARRQ
jgi:hypothetical protein